MYNEYHQNVYTGAAGRKVRSRAYKKREGVFLVGIHLLLFREKDNLFLSALVSLVELVHAAGGVDEFDFAGVERMRSVGNLNLNYRILNTFNLDGLLGGSAGTGDEYRFVGHILESYKTVGFGMNSFFHCNDD